MNIMSANFVSNENTTSTSLTACVPANSGLWHKLLSGKALVWIALPLTCLVGCASGPKAPGDYSQLQAPVAPPVLTQRQAADVVIAHEIYWMFLADKGINYPLSASVQDGAVSLGGTSYSAVERQRVVDGMWALAGVTEVKNEKGVDVTPTIPAKVVAVR